MKYIIALSIVLAMFISCGHKHDHDHDHSEGEEHVHGENCTHDHNHDQEHDHNHDPNAIIFTPTQASKIDFAVEHPSIEPFGQVIKTTAQIQSSQYDEVIIAAKAAGVILFTSNLAEGQSVSSGQTLFSISGSGIDNNSTVRFAEAKSNYERTLASYNRARELHKESIISTKEYERIKSEFEVAESIFNNVNTNFTGSGLRVSSSKQGYIKQLFVSNGQYVSEGEPLLSISSNRSLVLKADVQPKYASLLPYIKDAVIKTTDNNTYTLKDLNGTLLSSGRSLNEGNYLLPVTFQIDNKAGFVSGGFVTLYIKTQTDENAMTLPNSALTEEQGLFFVYVQLCQESYEKREVTLGATDGMRTEILSGLNRNEKVVTKGAMSVKLAQASGALDPHAGHVH